MVKSYSITDFILNRKKPSMYGEGIFRNVIGRFIVPEQTAQPVKVINLDQYTISQSSFTLVVANTEYTIQGIATLGAITVKARGGQVRLSIYEGQSGITFMLIDDGQSIDISVLPFAQINKPVSLYVQSATAGTVVEMLGLRLY